MRRVSGEGGILSIAVLTAVVVGGYSVKECVWLLNENKIVEAVVVNERTTDGGDYALDLKVGENLYTARVLCGECPMGEVVRKIHIGRVIRLNERELRTRRNKNSGLTYLYCREVLEEEKIK